MKHFQSKVLTAAILASFCSGALAASNSDETEVIDHTAREVAKAALVGVYNNTQEINGFKVGDTIYDIGENGKITEKKSNPRRCQ
ncbi:TPA: hypothetical protein ACFPCE_000891 [Neisseria meningitidis]